MVSFERMWDDVEKLLYSTESTEKIHPLSEIKNGFVVDEDGDSLFITKEDFVDFWCRMLYFHEVSKEQILSNDRTALKYVYEIIRKLPYIKEDADMLILVEE